MGRTEFLTCNQITSEPWLVEQKQRPQLERNGALRSARASAPQKCLTLPTLLETRFCVNNRSVPGRRKAQGQNRNAASQDRQFIRMFVPWRLLEPPGSRSRKRPLANFRGLCPPTSC